ncbi:MAG TPA: hypothetical protein VIP11_23175 [Gemmatimonadaceae bacterium]
MAGAQFERPESPRFDSLAFRRGAVDNPLFPLKPGTLYVFEIRDGDSVLADTVRVLHETRRIAGVTATVVHDRVSRRGAIVEDTFDWYAQDTLGNVWYLGEDTKEFRNGKLVSTLGSWRAGVAGARAGIIMKAKPRVGDTYRQEFREGVAEDIGRVVALNDSVIVRAGRFMNCVSTDDWSPLEPSVRERKTYCPGVGVVREYVINGGSERSELVAITTFPARPR